MKQRTCQIGLRLELLKTGLVVGDTRSVEHLASCSSSTRFDITLYGCIRYVRVLDRRVVSGLVHATIHCHCFKLRLKHTLIDRTWSLESCSFKVILDNLLATSLSILHLTGLWHFCLVHNHGLHWRWNQIFCRSCL